MRKKLPPIKEREAWKRLEHVMDRYIVYTPEGMTLTETGAKIIKDFTNNFIIPPACTKKQ